MAAIPCKALFRLPKADSYFAISQATDNPFLTTSYEDVGSLKGFVFAPFHADSNTPIVVISPDKVEAFRMPQQEDKCLVMPKTTLSDRQAEEEKLQYAADFELFHRHITSNHLQKIVLARSSEVPLCYKTASNLTLDQLATKLFLRACQLHSNQFVALISSPLTGYWLMATPEVLLRVTGDKGYTMALAGTMRAESIATDGNSSDEYMLWSEKNRQEQAFVAQYIAQSIAPFAGNMTISKPHTVRAANVCHLQTDFKFTLNSTQSLGEIIATLHPTPAVCGLPKAEAKHHILEEEHCRRDYYSGFAGTLNLNRQTNLFVSLRCMQIMPNRLRFFAGGGIMKESSMQQEWEETCAKMEAMKELLDF